MFLIPPCIPHSLTPWFCQTLVNSSITDSEENLKIIANLATNTAEYHQNIDEAKVPIQGNMEHLVNED